MFKNIFLISIILILSFFLISCNPTEQLSKQMPEDFNFSLQYGFSGKNEINTYTSTITKDLIENGTMSITFDIPYSDLEDIYNKLNDLDIINIKNKLIKEGLSIEPNSEYILNFTANDNEFTIYGDSTMYSIKNDDANNYIEFVRYVIDYVESTSEYKSLPESKGGYE